MAPPEVEADFPDDARLMLFKQRKHAGALELGLRIFAHIPVPRAFQQLLSRSPLAFAPLLRAIGNQIAPNNPPRMHSEADDDVLEARESFACIGPFAGTDRVAEQQRAGIARIYGNLLAVRHEPEMAMHVVERRHLPALLKKSATLY